MEQMQKADPAARKRVTLIILAGTAIGAGVIGAHGHYETEISAWLENNIAWLADNPHIVLLSGWVLTAPLLVLSGYLFLYGRRAAKARQMPPPGYAVVRDTVLKTGRQAALHGRFVQLLSIFLFCSGAAIPIIFWYLFDRLAGSA